MATPIVKWAGGKRQLLPEIKKRMPKEFGTYYEPFFGGGALFFDIAPKKAIINDYNIQLINVYNQVKKDYDMVTLYLKDFETSYNSFKTDEEKTRFYFDMRDQFNYLIKTNELSFLSAAEFIFLNKAGFNGLYRVNANGEFNVPSAHRKNLNLFDIENMKEVSALLKRCTIKQGDFEKACNRARENDFVFFDSPYYDTFDNYQAGGFSEDDHLRLARLFRRLSDRGVKCILTNNACDFIKDLYQDYNVEEVDVKRMINCDGNNRVGKEVIITNFEV